MATTATRERRMLTRQEAGQILGLGYRKIVELVANGRLAQRTYGYRTKRITMDSVERELLRSG